MLPNVTVSAFLPEDIFRLGAAHGYCVEYLPRQFGGGLQETN